MKKLTRLALSILCVLPFATMALADVGVFVYPSTGGVPSPVSGQTWLLNSTDLNLYAFNYSSVWEKRTLPHSQFAGVGPPQLSSDNTQGYAPCSLWYDGSGKQTYVCTDATTNAAVWTQTSAPLIHANVFLPTDTFINPTQIVAPGGTLAVGLAAQAPNTFWGGPTSGSPAEPTWRTITLSDLPLIPTAAGGTGSNLAIAQYDVLMGATGGGHFTNVPVGAEGTAWTVLSGVPGYHTLSLTAAQMLPLNDGQIYVGNGSNQPVSVNLSGVVTITDAGLTSLANNSVTNAMLRQSAALSVVGNSTNATANVADISFTGGHQFLASNSGGTALGARTITAGDQPSSTVDATSTAANLVPLTGGSNNYSWASILPNSLVNFAAPSAIGNTTPAAGTFTTLSATQVNNNCTVTHIAGSTSGDSYWSMPEQGSGYKKFLMVFVADTDTGETITFPTAFAHPPAVTCNTTSLSFTVSTTQITVPAQTATGGVVVVEGI